MNITPTTPLYSFAEASMFLRLGEWKLRYWTTPIRTKPALVRLTDAQLSLTNLVELHMVSMFRDEHGVSLQRVRRALLELAARLPHEPHPLLTKQYLTDGRDILTDIDGKLLSLIERGQMSFSSIVTAYAHRVEWKGRLPQRFYPWTVNRVAEADPENLRKSVVVDPAVQFGRPVVTGTRVTTKAIKDLWDVGTELRAIADEFDVTDVQVQDSVRLEERRVQPRKAG